MDKREKERAWGHGMRGDTHGTESARDINGNNVADLADLVIMANHYGQHYP